MFKIDETLNMLKEWQQPYSLMHPYLLFSKNDIPEITKNAQALFGDLEMMKKRLVKFLERRKSAFNAHTLSNVLLNLSFISLITNDMSSIQYSLEFIDTLLNSEWVLPFHKPLKIDLGVANTSSNIALIYDWLFDYMDHDIRSRIQTILINRVLDPFVEISSKGLEWWSRATNNWRSVICGDIGLVALALLDKYDKLKECLKESIIGVTTIFDKIGRDGGYYEGIGYWGYGIGEGVKFAEALKRVSNNKINLFEHPRLKITGYFALYLCTPDLRCFNFSDCRYVPPSGWLVAKLAAEYRDPYLQWLAQRLKIRRANVFFAIFYDNNIPSRKPDLPTYRVFRDIGVVVSRSSWDDDSSYLGFKTGATFVSHAHLDVNSFVFYAYGKRLIKDLGSWPYTPDKGLGFFDKKERRWLYEANSTLGHNTLLVDGSGQVCSEESYGKIVKTNFSKDVDLIIGDGHLAYGGLLTRFYRWLIFIKPNILVIIDDVSSDRPRRYELLFHPDGNIKEGDNNSFLIVNDNVFLKVQFLSPTPEEPHILAMRKSMSFYESREGSTVQENLYFSIAPLLKHKDFFFISVLYAHKDEIPKFKAYLSELADRKVSIELSSPERKVYISAQLDKLELNLHHER